MSIQSDKLVDYIKRNLLNAHESIGDYSFEDLYTAVGEIYSDILLTLTNNLPKVEDLNDKSVL